MCTFIYCFLVQQKNTNQDEHFVPTQRLVRARTKGVPRSRGTVSRSRSTVSRSRGRPVSPGCKRSQLLHGTSLSHDRAAACDRISSKYKSSQTKVTSPALMSWQQLPSQHPLESTPMSHLHNKQEVKTNLEERKLVFQIQTILQCPSCSLCCTSLRWKDFCFVSILPRNACE